MESTIRLLSSPKACPQSNATTRSMTWKCWRSSERWKSGDTTWKARANLLRSGRTIRTSSTSGPPRNSTAAKPDGPSTCPASTSPSTTSQDIAWASLTPSPAAQTTDPGLQTMQTSPSLVRNFSKYGPSKVSLSPVKNDRDPRRRIVKQHHDSRIAGHPGRWKTLELVSRSYWWPQMSRYIGLYTKTCDLCLRTKVQRHKPFGELHPSATPTNRWDTISVDFIVELPDSHGYDAVMNVVDSLGKRAHFIPTTSDITAEGAATLFLREVWKHHGLPTSVISDRGPQFIAKFTRELYHLLGIKLSTSMAYHPQSDGQTERVNQEMELYLRIFVNERQDNWDELLPLAEFMHNNSVHSSTQQTPFMTDTGRHPRMGFEP